MALLFISMVYLVIRMRQVVFAPRGEALAIDALDISTGRLLERLKMIELTVQNLEAQQRDEMAHRNRR